MDKITTKYGELEVSQLEKAEYVEGGILITDYYLDGELVHRSATVPLAGLQAEGIAKI